jgi:transposase-like protein
MTMTTADFATDDGVMGPRADRPKRRSFTAEFKARLLAEYDAADREERGAILRREGLYTSHIAEWRKAADAGAKAALASGGRARPGRRDRRDRELEALRARAEKAEAELARSRAALDLMGKAHALLETLSESAATDKRSRQ